jgi:hypothetical protein
MLNKPGQADKRLVKRVSVAKDTEDIWNVLERQTEQTNPMSTIFLWQKHAARKSILSCVGTARIFLMEGGGRKDIYDDLVVGIPKEGGLTIKYWRRASRRSRRMYDPPVRWAACCKKTVSGP